MHRIANFDARGEFIENQPSSFAREDSQEGLVGAQVIFRPVQRRRKLPSRPRAVCSISARDAHSAKIVEGPNPS
jgi:hypothetical protein